MSREPYTPQERRVREAVRQMPHEMPDTEFLARLKSDFVEGRLAQRERFRRPPRLLWAWIAVPAAAAVVALLLARHLFVGPADWVVLDTSGTGTADWAGRGHELAALSPGARLDAVAGPVRIEDGWLEIARPGALGVRLNPGTDADLAAADGPSLAWTLHRGELQVLTGPGFAGRKMSIRTPEGRVEVVGTAFAVFRDEGVTCVCVAEGVARIGVDEADLEEVRPGLRKVMFGDGREPEILDIAPEHRAGLEEFLGRVRGVVTSGTAAATASPRERRPDVVLVSARI